MFQEQIGQLFNLSQSAVSKIIISIIEGAKPKEKETRGAKSKLTDEQKEQLKELLLESPKERGYFMWNKWSIQSTIEQEFGVRYHETTYAKL